MKRQAVVILCWLAIGCTTPTAVRQLSQQQLQTQEAFGASLKAFLEVNQRFAESVAHNAERQLDELTGQIGQDYVKKAEKGLEKADNPEKRQTVLSEFAKNVQSNLAGTEAQKAQIAALIKKLKDKNQELQTTYGVIVEAQRQLNEYIQLEKWNDVLVQQSLGMIHLDQQKMDRLATDMTKIAGEVNKIIKIK